MRPLHLAAALALPTAISAARADPRPAMLPPEIASQFEASFLDGFGEPALWRPEARRGYRTRIRLTLAGVLIERVSMRIDERANGRLEGHLVFLNPRNRQVPHGRTESSFRVTRAQFDALRQSFERARLWSIYPEFHPITEVCIDGTEIIFERTDAEGYRFSDANAQCAAPYAMRQAAETMIDISGAHRVRHWLY